jgi:hypothetical protein
VADWIFQANPRLYDVHGAVAESRRDSWSTPRFRDRIALGVDLRQVVVVELTPGDLTPQ